MKVVKVTDHDSLTGYMIFCPGCKCGHLFKIGTWVYNGNYYKPTFTPSLEVKQRGEMYCHSTVVDGKITFSADTKHILAGKTVELEDI